MNSFYIIFIFFALNFQNFTSSTPLDDYVNQYDPNYGFKVVNYTYKGPGFTLYCLNMTSQKWLTGFIIVYFVISEKLIMYFFFF